MAENIVIQIDAEIGQGLTKALDILEKLGTVSKKDADAFHAMTASGKDFATGQNTVQKELSETEAGFKKVTDQGKKLDTAFDDSGKKLSSASTSIKKDLGGLNTVMAGIGSAIAVAFSVGAIIEFGKESVKAFQEAEKNALLLKSAVSVNGGLQQDFEALLQQSKELQKITIFSDDKIQQVQTAALQFGLTKDQVEKLIPVVADFASATGQDLQSALDGVLQGINGMGRGLKIYGVTIDEAGTRSSRLGEITDQLTKKFQGQAEAVGKTASGAAELYKNKLDDLQESIGERLSPVLNNLKGTLLEVSEALLEASGVIDSISFDQQFQKYKDSFKSKFSTTGIDELKQKFKELSDVQNKVTGNSRTLVLAEMAAVLDLIKEKTAATTKVITEESQALAKLANISKLSDAELKNILKTLNKFNDIDARDAIDKINKELEARSKANTKTVSERDAALQKLHELEKTASDNNVSLKAAEVNKIIELESKKQQAIRDLIESAGKASGAKVEPILLEFKQTGKADIEKTLQALKDAKFPVEELDKFTHAVDDVSDSFSRLQGEIINLSHVESLKASFADVFDFIENQVDETSTDIDKKFADKKIKLITEFDLSGGEIAFQALQDALTKLEKEQNKERLSNTIALKEQELANAENKNEQLKRIGSKELIDTKKIQKEITALKGEEKKNQLEDAKDAAAQTAKYQQQELDGQLAVKDAIINASHELVSALSDIQNNYYDNLSNIIQENKDKLLESYDEQLDANEKLHSDQHRGDRLYEQQKDELLKKRQEAEKKADKELRAIKREQAIANRNTAVFSATLSGIEGVARAFADYKFPYSAIIASIVGGVALVQIAAAASTPIPSYAKGVERVTGRGTETSDDVPANLSVGERVVKASTNRKYFQILHDIHRERFDPESLNAITKFTPETLKILSKADPSLIRELATMQPVFLKHIKVPETLAFRSDLAQQLTQRVEVNHIYQAPANSLDEYDITRALDRGTRIKNVGEIAKETAKELASQLSKEKSIRKPWR